MKKKILLLPILLLSISSCKETISDTYIYYKSALPGGYDLELDANYYYQKAYVSEKNKEKIMSVYDDLLKLTDIAEDYNNIT